MVALTESSLSVIGPSLLFEEGKMDTSATPVFKESVQGDCRFSELVEKTVPGDPSRYSIIILISQFLKSEGASRVAEIQAKELSKKGYSVTIYAFKSDISPIGYDIKIIDSWIQKNFSGLNTLYRALFPFNLWNSFWISSELKKSGLIIVHQETLVIVAYFTKLFYHARVIYWHHHIADARFLPFRARLYKLIVSPFNWSKIKKFDQVVSISNYSRVMLRQRKGVESIVVYDEVDLGRFNEHNFNGMSVRMKYRIKPDDPVILFVGRIIPTKNVHSLVAAFKVVKNHLPSAKLIVAGKSYSKQYLESLMKICDRDVIFTDFVPDEELPDYYAACDVYATCSLLEGFNMPLVEAQACGKPVVAFDIGPHKEVVKNGFLVDEGNIEKFGETLIRVLRGGRI